MGMVFVVPFCAAHLLVNYLSGCTSELCRNHAASTSGNPNSIIWFAPAVSRSVTPSSGVTLASKRMELDRPAFKYWPLQVFSAQTGASPPFREMPFSHLESREACVHFLWLLPRIKETVHNMHRSAPDS